ncbi:hypothetical protein [Streptomyces sp. NBC_01233]|uniref:hypothetical protein n=1 Tax=Streptomyces sp. NBC_01233 TaxID=2903787 RepID=UPI002E154C7E|nr:hypothetical protein OG332_36750 [Streptomyces sp. NBC_01233]
MTDAIVQSPAPSDGGRVRDLAVLRLPMAETPLAPCDGFSCRGQEGRAGIPAPRFELGTKTDDEAHAWYRWLLGHHVSFGVWRLICRSLSEAAGDADLTAELFDAYSALLLYSGSCTPQVYADAIRPRMMSCHPAFSGTWSRDYELVRLLLGHPLQGEPRSRLNGAVKFNRLVHVLVAKRLVPGGSSLLRDSGRGSGLTTDAERDLFDAFFSTRRVTTCACEFVDQLLDRIDLILADLTAHPVTTRYGRDDLDRFQLELRGRFERLSSTTSELITKGCAV